MFELFYDKAVIFFARAEGFEPPSTVLETAILPLNYARNLRSQIKSFFSSLATISDRDFKRKPFESAESEAKTFVPDS